MGELSGETLKNKGVRAASPTASFVTSTFCWRSASDLVRGFTPRDIVGYWLPVATNAPITIGDVVIAPGDYMVGDRDGLVRVPKALAEEVVDKAEAAMATESLVRKAILAGIDPQ